jgi:hypothetical protein
MDLYAIVATALVDVGLLDPGADGLGGRLELANSRRRRKAPT